MTAAIYNDEQGRQYPAGAAGVKLQERESLGANSRCNLADDQEAGNDKKDIDANKPSRKSPKVAMIAKHRKNSDGSQSINVWTIFGVRQVRALTEAAGGI